MAEDWVSCGDLYRFLCRDTDPSVAAGVIQLEALTGNIETRARKALFINGNSANSVVRKKDWPIPPRVWMEPLYYPTRAGTSYRFDALLSTIEAVGFSESDLRLPHGENVNIDDLLNPGASLSRGSKIVLSRIEINALDAADLGYVAELAMAELPSRASPFKAGRPPDDEAIIEKAKEMHARPSMTVQRIAKEMCQEPGFENAGNVHVREVLKGQFPRVGRAGWKRT